MMPVEDKASGGLLQIATVIAFIVSLIIQVGYPLGAILYFRRRSRTRWAVYAYGAAIFAVFQMFTWLPLSAVIDVVWGAELASPRGAFVWLMTMALLTALVEEGGRWMGYRYLFPRSDLRLTWHNGVAFGLGHNALETMWLIAGLTFISLVAYLVAGPSRVAMGGGQLPLGSSVTDPLLLLSTASVSWPQPLVVAVERILALPHQVAWSLLVMESLVSRQKRWFFFALLYHTSVAVIVPGLAQLAGFAVAEGVNLVLASLSVWIIVRLREVTDQRD
jgi:uncharacterized membrane protein YhfC